MPAPPDLAVRLCCLSWGSAALRGHSPHVLGRLLVPPDPFGVQRPSGTQSWGCRPAEACQRPSMRLRAPSEDDIRESAPPRTVPTACAAVPIPGFASSPGLWLPYGTVSAWWARIVTVDPSTVACHVWGLVTPFATYTTGSCDPRRLSAPHASQHVKRAGAPMGFPLHGFPLNRERYSSRSPCPPAVAVSCNSPPEGGERWLAVAFRALFPRRVRSAPVPLGASSHPPRPSIPS